MGANSCVKRGKRDMFAVVGVVENGRVVVIAVVVVVGLVMRFAFRWRGTRLSVERRLCIDDLIVLCSDDGI